MINKIFNEDCLTGLKKLPDNSIDCCVSSPPYWGLRDYGVNGQVGNENDYVEFVDRLTEIYKEVYRVLKPEGTCFVNLGDTYAGSGTNLNKCLLMIPERFAIKMIDTGWILRNQIIWHKPNQMPSSAKDRFTVDFEKIFFFVKQAKNYYFEQQIEETKAKVIEPRMLKEIRQTASEQSKYKGFQKRTMTRNARTVWSINTKPFKEAHFAVFPVELATRMIKSGCPENGLVLDPFMGAGTTAVTAISLNRNFVGFELNSDYCRLIEKRLSETHGLFIK